MPSIERLSVNDVERFRNLRLLSLKDTPEAFKSTYQYIASLPLGAWEEQLNRLTTFVAVVDGVDIGLVRCAKVGKPPDTAHLHSMWVAPTYRGQGIGEELIEAVFQWAKSKGFKQVILDVVENNQNAISLYKRMGFKFTGESAKLIDPKKLRELRMAADL